MYDTVYVEIVGSSSPRIDARGIRLVKVIVTRVRTHIIRVHVHSIWETRRPSDNTFSFFTDNYPLFPRSGPPKSIAAVIKYDRKHCLEISLISTETQISLSWMYINTFLFKIGRFDEREILFHLLSFHP